MLLSTRIISSRLTRSLYGLCTLKFRRTCTCPEVLQSHPFSPAHIIQNICRHRIESAVAGIFRDAAAFNQIQMIGICSQGFQSLPVFCHLVFCSLLIATGARAADFFSRKLLQECTGVPSEQSQVFGFFIALPEDRKYAITSETLNQIPTSTRFTPYLPR